MQNVIRAPKTVSEEELKRIKELDWNSYYKETTPSDIQGMTNCPNCNAIVCIGQDQSEISCYSCGEIVKP
jgi:hypothetical protein